MASLLLNFRNTIILGLVLALVMIIGFGMHSPHGFDQVFWQALFRWIHVFFGILWIGLLYYFNFVQIRKMPDIPAELKPAVSKYIAPEALFWFRWAALFTVLAGLVLAFLRGYIWEVLSFGLAGGYSSLDVGFTLLGVGIWLAINHVPERVGHHLAQPEDRARHQGGRRRRQGQGRAHRHPGQPHQRGAVAAHADRHGDVPDPVRLITSAVSAGRPARERDSRKWTPVSA